MNTKASKRRGEQRTWQSFALSALVHAILLASLLYGVHWKSDAPAGVEAELWNDIPEITAEPAVRSASIKKEAEKTEDAANVPNRVSASTKPLPAVIRSHNKQPTDIALERTRQQPNAPQRLAQQRQQQQKQQQQPKQQVQPRSAQKSEAFGSQSQTKAILASKKVEQQKNLNLKIKQQEAKERKERAHQQHQMRLTMLQHLAGKSPTGKGITQINNNNNNGSGGNNLSGYADKVRRHVKPNIIFDASDMADNPQTTVSVQCASDGTILNVSLSRSTGNSAWDEAVLRAVQKSDPMPRDSNGKAPRQFTIIFQPKG